MIARRGSVRDQRVPRLTWDSTWRILGAALVLVTLAGCRSAQSATQTPRTLRISGSTSMAPTLIELAEAYTRKHGGVRVEVLGNGSQAGLRELKARVVDVAAISWKPEGAEPPTDLKLIPFARDGVAIVVHPRNPVAGLTLAHVRSIYRGEVQDWKTVGGPSAEPIVVSREEGSGTRSAFESLVMNGEQVSLNAVVMPTTQAVVEHVAQHPEAIGYISTSALTDTVRAVPVEDLMPTQINVRSNAYHLSRYLYLVAHAAPGPEVQRFLDYVGSAEGQAIIARRLVPLR